MACRAQCLKVLDPVHDRRVEDRSYGNTFDVVRLKVLTTAALGAFPSISLKRQKAVGEIDFIIVLRRNRLCIGHIYYWVIFF